MKERLHRDEVDGCIVLIRLPGDRWQVVSNQADCDFVRSTEVQSPSRTRLGVCGYSEDSNFVRVQRISEEPIEAPNA